MSLFEDSPTCSQIAPAAPLRPGAPPVVQARPGAVGRAGFLFCLILLTAGVGFTPGSKDAAGLDTLNPPTAFRKRAPTTPDDLKEMERHLEALIQKVAPVVVAVQVGDSVGSAVVISADGLVACAAHVCGAPDRKVVFTFPDGRTARGKTLGTNHEMDSGLMKITDPGPWSFAPLAAPGTVSLGDWVVALGHPGGFELERPIVARMGRVIRSGSMLQTDCTLLGGDSGGPLFDMRGQVVGIHSRISEATTENFHVPVATFVATWDRLKKGENWGNDAPLAHPTIGVHGVDSPDGCRLERVNEDGPAAKAGLLAGDLITRIGDELVTNAECLVHCVRQASPGSQLRLTIVRAGTELTLPVTVEGRPSRSFRGRPGRNNP